MGRSGHDGQVRRSRASAAGGATRLARRDDRRIHFQPERAAGRHSVDRACTEQDAAVRGRGPTRCDALASEARVQTVNLATAQRAHGVLQQDRAGVHRRMDGDMSEHSDMGERNAIRYEVADGVATITLDRPDRLNAFNVPMARGLIAAFDASDADDDVRAVLMTGSGRGFCAGADLAQGTSTFDVTGETPAAERAEFGTIGEGPRDVGGVVSLRIAASRKPVIVAVNGPAVGIGWPKTLP